jgi:hypothetical protein
MRQTFHRRYSLQVQFRSRKITNHVFDSSKCAERCPPVTNQLSSLSAAWVDQVAKVLRETSLGRGTRFNML